MCKIAEDKQLPSLLNQTCWMLSNEQGGIVQDLGARE